MSVSGVNGSQPIQPNENSGTNNVQQQVEKAKASIFLECDTDHDGVLEAKNDKGDNEVKTFWNRVNNYVNSIRNTQSPEQIQEEFTNIDTNEVEPQFNEDGSVQSDVKMNEDGSKDIKAGDETIHVEKDGNSFSVTNEDGRNVSITKTPDGGFEFTDENGEKHKFDKDMNPQ